MVLLYTSPIFIMVISAIVFKEKITRNKLLALAMVFVGCVLVAGLLGGGYALTPTILLLGWVPACSMGCTLSLERWLCAPMTP